MKKALIIILISISQLRFLRAQFNLVPNSGFESVLNCVPFPSFYAGDALNWDSPSDGSPDLYDTCATPYSTSGVPHSGLGYQYPHTGHSFIGIAFFSQSSGNDEREYIQVKLDSTLIAGKKYCASYYVNLADPLNVACNNFGMYFSNAHHYVPSLSPLNFTPQINDTSIVSDTAGWTLVSGDFIANGGEQYLIIGNFYSNALTDTMNLQGLFHNSYYNIDDIDVHYCDPSGVDELNNGVGFEVFPNPSTGIFTLESKNKISNVKVFNLLGEKIYNEELKETITTTISLNAPPGVYFVETTTQKGIQRKRIVMQ